MSVPSLFSMDDGSPADGGIAIDATASDLPKQGRGTSGQTQSLYRKYRPQSFDAAELVGQEHVVQTLRNAIMLDRVAHAYLFCGPRGTGKTTTARVLAKAVNCLDPDPLRRPCNACASCRAIATGATTDVIEIDAASNRGIDDIRDLRERVKYAPTQLRTKFYIIDEAHQITGAAANAFLKTLEEPPGHTKFVLATTDPEELLPTIVSRCQRFDFRRIGADAAIHRLRDVATAEGLRVSDEALEVIARHATGSLRDALGLLDQLAVFRQSGDQDQNPEIDAESVRALLGVSRNDRVEVLATALADRDAAQALAAVNEAVEAGEDPRQLNRQLVAYLRVLLHERAHGSPDADERARALAKRFELLELANLARLFSEIDYKLRHSSYGQLPLEVAMVDGVLRAEPSAAAPQPTEDQTGRSGSPPSRDDDKSLSSVPPTTSLRDRVRGVASVAPERPAAPVPPTALPVAPASQPAVGSNGLTGAPNGVDIERLVDLWPRIRQDVKALNRRIEALLSSVDPVAVNGNAIILAAAYDFHRARMNTDEVRAVVEDVIGRLLGRPVQVSCVLRTEVVAVDPADGANRQDPMPSTADEPSPPSSAISDGEPGATEPVRASSAELDEQRVQAAKNIFDAEEIRD